MVTKVPLLLALAMLGGCFSSAHAAREHSTTQAVGWVCYSAPEVTCPNREDKQCTGWDSRWLAKCPDTANVFECHNVVEHGRSGNDHAECNVLTSAP